MRKAVAADRSQFFKELPTTFYGFNRPGAKVSEGLRDSFWLQAMMGGQGRIRLRQGLFRDRLHRGPEDDQRPDADFARRRRPDRANRQLGASFGEADQE